MTGGAGDDVYRVDSAQDVVVEQAGGGIFSVITGSGKVTVAYFGANGDADGIELTLGDAYDTVAEVMAAATMMSDGNTLFRFSTGDRLVLLGVDMATPTADNFILDGDLDA